MDRTILIPLDGSLLAEQAIPFAEVLARATGARLLLLRAAGDSRPPRRDECGASSSEARRYLDRLVAPLRRRGVAAGVTAPRGDVVGALAREAGRRAIDVVVMATRGRGPIGGSSVAERLLTCLPVPVLLVRAWHADAACARLSAAARIVVPLDGSTRAEAALPVAGRFASALGAELLLLQVVAPDIIWTHPAAAPTAGSGAATRQATARAYLRRLATTLEAEGIRTGVEVSIGGAAEVIAAALLRHDAALVVLTTHGQSGVAQMPLGSVAKTVCWCGYVPTLLIRPPAMLPGARTPRARGNTPFGELPRGIANGC